MQRIRRDPIQASPYFLPSTQGCTPLHKTGLQAAYAVRKPLLLPFHLFHRFWWQHRWCSHSNTFDEISRHQLPTHLSTPRFKRTSWLKTQAALALPMKFSWQHHRCNHSSISSTIWVQHGWCNHSCLPIHQAHAEQIGKTSPYNPQRCLSVRPQAAILTTERLRFRRPWRI